MNVKTAPMDRAYLIWSPARTGQGQCSPSTSCGWCRRSTGGRTGPASLRPAAGTTAASISREKQR